jgi:hypothetical protein
MRHWRSPNDSAKTSSASPDSRGPPPEPTSPFRSSYSTGPFSLREESSDIVTDLDGWTAESDDSESDDEELNVIQLLDIRLVSVLSGDLDLAARLIPKIHDLLDSEIHAEIPDFTDSTIQDYTSHQGGGANKGKQRASGSSSSGRSNWTGSSGSSQGKHGRDSGGSNESDEWSNPSNKPRREPGRNPGSSGNGDSGNTGDGQDGSTIDPISSGSTADIDRDAGDPGDEPVEEDLPSDPIFACHFQKRDHIKYGPWNKKYVMCSSCRMEELRRIR